MTTTTTTTEAQGTAVETKLDLELIEETAIAVAQAEIHNAMNASHMRPADIARKIGRPKSFISRILGGDHNLTIRTMARIYAACGFAVRFKRVPLSSAWTVTNSSCSLASVTPIYSGDAPMHVTTVTSVGASPGTYGMAI